MKLLLPLINALPSVLAQYYGSSDSSTSASVAVAAAPATASSSSYMQTIMVGNGGIKFSPDTLTVKPGNSVVFHFYPSGHSTVQCSFDKPCAPSNDSSFSSGTANSDSAPASQVFTVPINSTDPIWFYCAQVGHYQGGMVGVINPPGRTLDQYKNAASSAGSSTKPAGVQGGTLGAASSAAASGSSSPSGSASAKPSDSDGLALRITAGGFLTALAVVFFAFMI